MTTLDQYVSVRYVVDDVQAAVDFYTGHLGFAVRSHPAPAFADVVRGNLRLLLSGPESSGARATPADAAAPGRNRIHLEVDDLNAEIKRLRAAGREQGAPRNSDTPTHLNAHRGGNVERTGVPRWPTSSCR